MGYLLNKPILKIKYKAREVKDNRTPRVFRKIVFIETRLSLFLHTQVKGQRLPGPEVIDLVLK
jgi:hypothetical protein